LLMTGLWPEAVRVLLTLSLQLEVSPIKLDKVLKSLERRANRFGLMHAEDIVRGFEVLFGKFMPILVLQEVHLSFNHMIIVLLFTTFSLLAFFAFLGLAFTSFESLKSGVSTAVQSMLAVLGAVGLQSGASQEAAEVEQRMKQHIEAIMGDKLSKAREQVEELQEKFKPQTTIKEGKPLKVLLLD
ncbi:hypothetical protein EMWEY_00059870, partial [Eimeria maxima]